MRSPHRYTAPAAILFALTIVAASCGDDDSEPPQAADDAETTSTDAPTTTVIDESTTTTVATEGPQEWVQVVQELYARDFALLQDPDPDRVDDLYSPACDCWEAEFETVRLLDEDGDHVEGQPANVLFVQHEGTNQGFTDLTIQVQANPLRIIDANGREVQELEAGSATRCLSLTVVPDGPNNTWRIHTRLPLTGCPPEAER